MTNRVSFLIDGFNVYHSIKAALKDGGIKNAKWLDYTGFCQSFLGEVKEFGSPAAIARIHYFTALATHLSDPKIAARHRAYIAALTDRGVHVVLANFKQKNPRCSQCGKYYVAYEEKETDVNIAVALIRAFIEDECDTAVIVSGDTDLVAAVTAAKSLFPAKKVAVAFPYRRYNTHFKSIADFTFKIKPHRYERYQLANPVVLNDGTTIDKPLSW